MKYFLAVVFSTLAFAATSQATVCKMGKSERKVEVVTTDASKKVPCEVKYTRDGEEKTLWNAQADESFCETKASEFIAKLTAQGWQCEGGDAASAPAPSATPEKSAEKSTESTPAPKH